MGDSAMFRKLICAAAVILAALSCSKDDGELDIFASNEVCQTVKHDFYRRYSQDVEITRAARYAEGDMTQIEFVDTDGLKCTAIYKEHTWMMTQKEYCKDGLAFLGQLPANIARAYIRTGIDGEDYDDDNSYVIEVSRNGADRKVYEFEFYAPYSEGDLEYENYDCHVLVGEDGELIDVLHSGINRSIWWYDMSDAISSVRNKYPDALILAAINDSGTNTLYIKDRGILKTVKTDHDDKWKETSYRLADNFELPENVRAEYLAYKSENPTFEYSEIYSIERKDGLYYGLTMLVFKNDVVSRTIYIKA